MNISTQTAGMGISKRNVQTAGAGVSSGAQTAGIAAGGVNGAAGTGWLAKLSGVRIMGFSLPMYAVVAGLVLAAAYTGVLPANMVGALAIMMVLGALFHELEIGRAHV